MGGRYMRCVIIGVLAFCTLSGCATKYEEMGFRGGVSAEQMTSDTWRIRARGNAYTNSATVQDFVFLKAAETTQAAGGTHFQIISAADTSKAETYVSSGTSTTTIVGRQATTTTTPGSVDTVIKPGEDVYIRILKLAPSQQTQGAISAAEIIQFTGPRVKKDS
jgi:hypothetical protein